METIFQVGKKRERWRILGSEEAQAGKFQRRRLPYQSWLRDFRNGRGVLSGLCRGMLGSGEPSFILPESPRSFGKERKAVPFMEDIYLLAKVFSLSPGQNEIYSRAPLLAMGCQISAI